MDIKILKFKKKFKKSEHEPDPDFYWKMVLLGTFVLIILSTAFGVSLFFRTSKEVPLEAVQYNEQGKKINTERIGAVLKYYSDRQAKSESIVNSPSPVRDPSM